MRGAVLDPAVMAPLIRAGLDDSDHWVQMCASEAAEHLEVVVGWRKFRSATT